MCIACEMAFWMDEEEAERVAALRKAPLSRADDTFACDAPDASVSDVRPLASKDDGRSS